MASLTLWDLFTLQRNDPQTGLIEDVTTLAPEFTAIPAVAKDGTYYEIVSRTALPTVQFRNLNAGVAAAKSSYKKMRKEMFLLDSLITMDEAIVKAQKDMSVGDAWNLEAAGATRQASIFIGAQTWYGTSNDSKGFAGIRAQLAGNIGAGGSTSSTSAYLLWMDSAQGVRFDVGNGGQFTVSAPQRQLITDPNDSTKSLFAWVGNLNAFIGLNVGSAYSTWAVTGIDSSHKLTDVLANQLVSNIPMVRRSNLKWFYNRSSEYYLQSSRTAIAYQVAGSAGTPAYSPTPDRLNGYPIVVTDSITNTESN
jgi:hypothetical protein